MQRRPGATKGSQGLRLDRGGRGREHSALPLVLKVPSLAPGGDWGLLHGRSWDLLGPPGSWPLGPIFIGPFLQKGGAAERQGETREG